MIFLLLLLCTVNSFQIYSDNTLLSRKIVTNVKNIFVLNAKSKTLQQSETKKSSENKNIKSATNNLDKNEGQNTLTQGSGSQINQLIIDLFQDRDMSPKQRMQELNKLIKSNRILLNHVHAVTMLQRSARSRLDITDAVSLQLIEEIIGKSSHRDNLSSMEAAHAIYGLRMLHSETKDIKSFINLLTHLVLDCDENFKGQEIGNALYGLQKFSSDSIEIKKLLNVLVMKFKDSSARLSAQEISNALYGLRKMSSDSTEVISIVQILTQKLNQCTEEFNSQCIGNSFNGLQGMDPDSPVVVDLLRALIKKLAKSNSELTSATIGSALMGLRRMNTDKIEVRTILALFALKISDSKAQLDQISFSSAMNGLRSMGEETIEMRALLGTLNDKILKMPETTLNPNILSNALSGLRKFSGESFESRSIIAAVYDKMGDGDVGGQYNSLEIGRALYGFQNMQVELCPDVTKIFIKMGNAVTNMKGPLYARDCGLALYGLKTQTDESAEVKAILKAINSKLSKSVDSFSAKSISMAMMGLSEMTSESPEVCQILTTLANRMDTLDSQACGNIIYSMKKMNSDHSAVRGFLKVLASKIEACEDMMSGQELANAFYGLQGMGCL
jgi:hypothetical protein